jgi:hypothetical protein
MNRIKTWHLAIIGLFCLMLGAGAAVLWVRNERTAQASALPGAARMERANGEVGLNRGLDSSESNAQWINAETNTPVSVGDRIYTKDKSDASIEFTGRNFARLNEDTSLDVLALEDTKTQLALRSGAATFDIGSLSSGDLFEIATPCGAVDLTEPGLYQIEINNDDNATATAFSGVAQVVGQSDSGRIEKGQVMAVSCDKSATPTLSRVEPRAAGAAVDHYYRERYPRSYDGRYANYDSYLSDPFYYDPSRRFASYQYVSDYIPGVDDLDYYGDWQEVSDYGYCWRPRVDSGWSPYQEGYWTTDYPFGLTWISNEPWGYAPYHYGRWASVGSQWFWVPDRARTRPAYSPALVAFLPVHSGAIGWVPLGPGDPYGARYYDHNWTPRYLTRTRDFPNRITNLNVAGAVTVVNIRDFNRSIDRHTIEHVDARQLAQVRPVMDPFAVRNFRDAALRSRDAGRRFEVPSQVAQRFERTVVASATPQTPFRRDLAQRFQVRPVPDNDGSKALQMRDNKRSATATVQPLERTNPNQPNLAAEQARERRIADLSREAARGNGVARQQIQQLRRQESQKLREQVAPQRQLHPAQEGRLGNRVGTGVDQRIKSSGQPPQLINRGRQPAVQPPPQQNVLRHIQREPKVQAQPPRAQAMPQMRTMREQRPPQAQRQTAQPRPLQTQPRPQPPAQPQPRPQPQVQLQPVQVRPPQPQQQSQPPKPQQRGNRHPPN